ncbi:MAG TPA: ATP-binding cassette domain-containing protein, partial [Candidatus Sumerlaeota bacterium]|nr:ATP-binding cassette domain-containing protein [Candidatus Sumerlaeota bacterium]
MDRLTSADGISVVFLVIGCFLAGAALFSLWISARSQQEAPDFNKREKFSCFRLRHLVKDYQDSSGGEFRIFDGLSLDIPLGRMVGILGPSGCGKSTLLNLLGGIDAPDRGSISIVTAGDSQPVMVQKLYATGRVAFIFQELNLISHLSAEMNTALPLLCRGVSRREALSIARGNMERLGLSGKGKRKPSELSGGERQRLAIARALTQGADILLADEITGSLDEKNAEFTIRLLKHISSETGLSVILVTHNEILARRYCGENNLIHLDRMVRSSASETPAGRVFPAAGSAGQEHGSEPPP